MRNVLISEKDPIVRKLLEIFVTSCEHYRLIPSMYSAKEPINLILLDMVTALEGDALKAVRDMKSQYPEIKIVAMTDLPEYSYIAQAHRMGADSFWYKEPSAESLLSIMDRTIAGESVYPTDTPVSRLGSAYSTDFTERELEVLKEVVGGKTDAEIADSLKLSVSTVKFHIQKIREKTGFTNRTELAVRARESGLVISQYHNS